ncbi:MAG: PRC-barrel domain-containing protein [Methanobacteriaceae archaeon]|nr:PRC-barrel domain-containing protein [Methanobacteriaceae archaeon]
MRSKDIIGKEVLDTEVHTVGKVIDIEIDPENYTIKSLIVQEGNIQERINIKKSENVIPIEMLSTIGDKILLKNLNDDEDLDAVGL